MLTLKEIEELSHPKYKQALINLVSKIIFLSKRKFFFIFIILHKNEHYHKTALKKRHHIIRPLKSANLKYKEVRRLGFNASKSLWRTCMNMTERSLGDIIKYLFIFF
jgi:hypothetical protein